MRTIQLEDASGVFRIEVPDECRVTFGPISMRHGGDCCVRVYKTQTEKDKNLLAFLPGVTSFRELSTIRILRPLIDDTGTETWSADDDAWRRAQEAKNRLEGDQPAKSWRKR